MTDSDEITPARILAISGSLRRGSYNTSLLHTAAHLLPADVGLDLYEELTALPYYSIELDTEPALEPVARLRAAAADADALLISTPEFNGSIPGALKNALDWASRPFPGNTLRGKPVAIMGASVGRFGAARAQADLRKVLGVIGADVLAAQVAVGQAQNAFAEDGRLIAAEPRAALADLLDQLVARTGARSIEADASTRRAA